MQNEEYTPKRKDPNGYKIRCGFTYFVYKSESPKGVIYKIPVNKKDMQGNKIMAYRIVSFANKDKNIDIPNGALIKPLAFFEDFYYRSDDPEHRNPQWKLVIMDWEVIKSPEQIEQDHKESAINEYNSIIDEDDFPF